jgi:hypothetical protein
MRYKPKVRVRPTAVSHLKGKLHDDKSEFPRERTKPDCVPQCTDVDEAPAEANHSDDSLARAA